MKKFSSHFSLANQRGETIFSHVRKAFRPITKHLQGKSCFRQLCLSCSQNNFSIIELFVVLSQTFQESISQQLQYHFDQTTEKHVIDSE